MKIIQKGHVFAVYSNENRFLDEFETREAAESYITAHTAQANRGKTPAEKKHINALCNNAVAANEQKRKEM